MSKAFTKENDDETPERSARKRSASGLPPGAANYLSETGALRFRRELEDLEKDARAGTLDTLRQERLLLLRDLLQTATVVPHRDQPEEVLFGSTVILQTRGEEQIRYRIVGVDEESLEPDGLSWCNPLARVLLGARVGQLVQLPDGRKAAVARIA